LEGNAAHKTREGVRVFFAGGGKTEIKKVYTPSKGDRRRAKPM